MRRVESLPEELDDPINRALLRPMPPPDPGAPAPRAPTLSLAFDEDPYLGLFGTVVLRKLADGLEEHHVRRARKAGWSWAEIGAVLELSPQGAHKRHARRLGDDRHAAEGDEADRTAISSCRESSTA